MSKEKTLDIIKNALIIEHRGKSLYATAAEKSDNQAAKAMFQMMVEEEEKHTEILGKQFASISKGNGFDIAGLDQMATAQVKTIITDKIAKGISAAGYESAVIGAALEMEKSAVKYYGEQEAKASSSEEKKLFNWLVKWETEHMEMLAKLDNEIKEQVWYDNNFWPLD